MKKFTVSFILISVLFSGIVFSGFNTTKALSALDVAKNASLAIPGFGPSISAALDAYDSIQKAINNDQNTNATKTGTNNAGTNATNGTTGTGTTIPANLGNISGSIPTSKVNTWQELMVTIINWLLVIAGALALLAVIYSGIMYISAGGDPARAESAKKNLTWAIFGVVIVLLAVVIVNWVPKILNNTFGG